MHKCSMVAFYLFGIFVLIFIQMIVADIGVPCPTKHASYWNIGPTCDVNCHNFQNPPKACPKIAQTGCFCDKPYVRNGKQCVEESYCKKLAEEGALEDYDQEDDNQEDGPEENDTQEDGAEEDDTQEDDAKF